MTWERITVRRLPGGSFIGEGRLHADFAVGAICVSPSEALRSAAEAMDKLVEKRFGAIPKATAPAPKPVPAPKPAPTPAPKPAPTPAPYDPLEDL